MANKKRIVLITLITEVSLFESGLQQTPHAASLLRSGAFFHDVIDEKSLRAKVLAPFALVVTLDDNVRLSRSFDRCGQLHGFLFCCAVEGRVGPANMVVNP